MFTCDLTTIFNFSVVVAVAVLVVVLAEEAVADFLVAAVEAVGVTLGAADLQFRVVVTFLGLEGADITPNNAPLILAGARICY